MMLLSNNIVLFFPEKKTVYEIKYAISDRKD